MSMVRLPRVSVWCLVLSTALFAQRDMELRFSVIVSGFGLKGATCLVPPSYRVIDVIEIACRESGTPSDQLDIRRVSVKSARYSDTLDLLRFTSNGDLSQNPLVEEGMHIHLEPARRIVTITGAIAGKKDLVFPLKEAETLGNIVSLIRFSEAADTTVLLLTRPDGATEPVPATLFRSTVLQGGEVVTIQARKEIVPYYSAEVSGEVASPGTLPIQPGITKATDLLASCGGATVRGDLSRCCILRKSKMDPLAPATASGVPGLTIQNETRTAFFKVNATNEHALVVLKDHPDAVVEDGDEVHVPAIETRVYVGGAVKTPGAYTWAPGQDQDHYISMAGGYSRNADRGKTQTITRYGSAATITSKGAVDAGDILAVSEKDRERRFRAVLSVLGTLALITTSSISIAGFIRD